MVIPFEKVRRDDVGLVGGDRRERSAPGRCGIARRVGRRIRNALKILVDPDPALFSLDACLFERQIVDLWHPPPAVNREIRFEGTLLTVRGCTDLETAVRLLDGLYLCGQVHVDAEPAGSLHQPVDEIGVEPLERRSRAMEEGHGGSRPSGHVGELEGDIAPSHE